MTDLSNFFSSVCGESNSEILLTNLDFQMNQVVYVLSLENLLSVISPAYAIVLLKVGTCGRINLA